MLVGVESRHGEHPAERVRKILREISVDEDLVSVAAGWIADYLYVAGSDYGEEYERKTNLESPKLIGCGEAVLDLGWLKLGQ